MIKHLFCDLDGTLIVDHQVSQEDKRAIRRFVENGGQFHIITGRTLAEIDQFMRLEDLPATYRIGNNGCQVLHRDTMVLNRVINPEILTTLQSKIERFVKTADFFEVTANGFVYYPGEVKHKKMMKYKENNLVMDADIFQNGLFQDGVTKMYMEATEALVAEFIHVLNQDFSEDISHFGEITNVNVGPKGVSKGSALQFLQAHHGLDSFAVIGDGANDIPMFDVAEHSFSFHRAKPFVSERAQYRVHTVAEAIDQLLTGKVARK